MCRFDKTCRQGGLFFSYHKSDARPREAILGRTVMGVLLLAAVLSCGGCGTMGFAEDDQLVTGSIAPRVTQVSAPVPEGAAPQGIAEADWLEAKRALDQALTSHDKDPSIPWENKAGGAHGTATPIGAERSGGCRDFIISVVGDKAPDRWIQGTACRARDGGAKGASGKGVFVLSQVRMLGRA